MPNREDIDLLKRELDQLVEKPKFRYGNRVKEVAFGLTPPREETPKERTLRLYPHYLLPTRAEVEREKKRIGITSFGSPGIAQYLDSFLAWSKAHWPWIAGGTVLYAVLLAAALRK